MARLDWANYLAMGHNVCDQDYFDPAGVPDWASKFMARMGWKPWGGETGSGVGGEDVSEFWINKVWDPGGGGGWEYWATTPYPDPSGVAYPDPHGTGFGGCSGYRVVGTKIQPRGSGSDILVPSEKVLWEWNGVDLSQFTLAGTYGSPNMAFSVAQYPNTVDAPPINRIVATNNGGTGGYLYWINDLPTLPDIYIVEHIQGPRSAGALGQNTVPEVAIFGQDVSHMLTVGRGGPGSQTTHNIVISNNTTRDVGGGWKTFAASLLHNDDAGYFMRHRVGVLDPTVSTDPRVRVQVLGPTLAPGEHVISAGGFTLWGTGTQPWDVSWRAGGTIKKVGILFEHETANPGSGYLAKIRVLGV